MHSSRLPIPLEHSWPRLGAVTRRGLGARLRKLLVPDRSGTLAIVGVCALLAIGWFSVDYHELAVTEGHLLAVLPQSEVALQRERAQQQAAARAQAAVQQRDRLASAAAAAEQARSAILDDPVTLVPDRRWFERHPSTHLPIDPTVPTRIRVVTIRAKVTGYTAYDHRRTHPQWADGVVAWHPDGRKRRVQHHPYGIATDWAQFPPGATFIDVPGYLERTFPGIDQRFIAVDDACGAARAARRRGAQPVIDLRFQNRSSIIGGKDSWGTRHLDVDVVFPAGYRIPSSLRRWVVREEWRTYYRGERVE